MRQFDQLALWPVRVALFTALLVATACSTLPAFGPSADAIVANAQTPPAEEVSVLEYDLVELSAATLPRKAGTRNAFSNEFVRQQLISRDNVITSGDVLDIRIWEVGADGLFASNGQRATVITLVVGNAGFIDVPYAGRVEAAGMSTEALRKVLLERYQGQALGPEVSVRITQSESRYVTVVGEVKSPKRVPLPASGIRLLDVLAEAGGTPDPDWEVELKVTRNARSSALRLDKVKSSPANNIVVLPGDTVQVSHTPRLYAAFGAVARPGQVTLSSAEPNLAELLAKVGGLDDDAAEANSVFVFRQPTNLSANSRVIPSVYRLDFARPDAFIVAQAFALQTNDIVYAATADAKEFRKFTSTLLSPFFGAVNGLQNLGN